MSDEVNISIDNESQQLQQEAQVTSDAERFDESVQESEATAQTGNEPETEIKSEPEPEEKPEPKKPVIMVSVAGDNLTAFIEFARIAAETLPPTEEDIRAALAEKGVVWGIDEKYLPQLCVRTPYGSAVEIAKGVSAKIGKDGYLKYLIETKRDLRPKTRPDGTTDYYDLGYIQNVKAEQPLCEVHNAEKGEDGHNVYGVVLEGMYGREPDVPIGKNTLFDEERGFVIAELDGNAVVTPKGIIDVNDVLNIVGNVDNSTGNLSFTGDIIISKDVASGFRVESQGNIVVKGTVEGAYLSAKGDITVGQSINGMNRARIIAGGNVRCKYIQYCHMETGENIYAESIMHCTIECSGGIELGGKRGSLIGGRTVVAKALSVKGIGTDAHVATHITMAGGGLVHNKRILDLKKQIHAIDTEAVMLVQTMNWCESLIAKGVELKPFQLNAHEHGKVRIGEIKEERAAKIALLEESQKELNNINPAECYIKCSGRIHTGVKIMFGMHTLTVSSSFVNSRVYLFEGEIVVSSQ